MAPRSLQHNVQYDSHSLTTSQLFLGIRRRNSSSESSQANDSNLLTDIWQTQSNLWSIALSTLLTYLWRNGCRPNALVTAFVAVVMVYCVAWVAMFIVVGAHVLQMELPWDTSTEDRQVSSRRGSLTTADAPLFPWRPNRANSNEMINELPPRRYSQPFGLRQSGNRKNYSKIIAAPKAG